MRTLTSVPHLEYSLPGQTHTAATAKVILDLPDIQSFLLYPVAFPHARYCFFEFPEGEGARRFVADVTNLVTDATLPAGAPHSGRKPCEITLGFTWPGLIALDVPPRALRSFPLDFQQGMKDRARDLLIDRGDSDPEMWEEVFRSGRIHAIVIVQGMTEQPMADHPERTPIGVLLDRVLASAASNGVTHLATQVAGALVTEDSGGLPTDKEHFGYSDGITNPDIEGDGWPAAPGNGKPDGKGGWIPIKAGEFILGYENEAGEFPEAPVPITLARNGSFLAYRKLHEHVGRFRRWLSEEGVRYPGGRELLAAKLIGRFRDGTPLVLSSESPYNVTPKERLDPAFQAHLSDFTYGGDAEGARCPMGAHIRRANPRDSLGFDGILVNQRRIIRRGLPYGTWVPLDTNIDELEASEDVAAGKESERGVIFMALNASLERQFEFVQREWLNYGNDFRQGNDRDPVLGNRDGQSRMVVQGDSTPAHARRMHICRGLPQFVTTRGGEYFFVPGIAALHAIANGAVEHA